METVLYHFFVDVPRAAFIWTGLITLAVIAMAVLIALPRRERRAEEPELREEAGRQAILAARAREASRYADEVAVAADRAAETARRQREQWLAAQEEAEAAWRAYDEADAAARRLLPAAALPAPRTPRTPAEYADRERYLHRAAMSACSHRQLPVLELSDVLANRNGWDPRRHPVEQEVILRRTVRDRLWAEYRAAVQREQEAWQAAEVAATAARSLREEAFAAAARAHRLRPWLAAETVAEPSPADTIRLPQRQSVIDTVRIPQQQSAIDTVRIPQQPTQPTLRWHPARAS
ncbi:hypothetical protein AB0J86_00540 [Micromonospora sp. NPDC049559]|uniref:hypothetical protein n=1 Tax=Micromonospora sp. NPDC049559 TaxID=3155923 RepID=UPI00343A738F